MDIDISQLRQLLSLLLDYVEQQRGENIGVEADAYWFVSKESIHDPYTESPELTMGQLSDDWQNLKKILDGKDDPVGYALVWASTVLRAIGDEVE